MEDEKTTQLPWVEKTGRTLVTVEVGGRGSIKKLIELEEGLYSDLWDIGVAMGEEGLPHVERAITSWLTPAPNPARRGGAPARLSEPPKAPRRGAGPRLSLVDTPRRA